MTISVSGGTFKSPLTASGSVTAVGNVAGLVVTLDCQDRRSRGFFANIGGAAVVDVLVSLDGATWRLVKTFVTTGTLDLVQDAATLMLLDGWPFIRFKCLTLGIALTFELCAM